MKNQKPLSIVKSKSDLLLDLYKKLRTNTNNLRSPIKRWWDDNTIDGVELILDDDSIEFRSIEIWTPWFLRIDLSQFPAPTIRDRNLKEKPLISAFIRKFFADDVMNQVWSLYDKNVEHIATTLKMHQDTRREYDTRFNTLCETILSKKTYTASGSVWEGDFEFESVRDVIAADKLIIHKRNASTSNITVLKNGDVVYRNVRMGNDLLDSNLRNFMNGNLKFFDQYGI